MNHKPNRAEKRLAAIYDHPAYIWAIESDRPQWWAVELAASYNIRQLNFRRERQLGHRLTFTKFPAKIKAVTDDAILAILTEKNGDATEPSWIPRSNVRSDDDKRMSEIQHQLQSTPAVNTHVFVADWFVIKRGWNRANNPV